MTLKLKNVFAGHRIFATIGGRIVSCALILAVACSSPAHYKALTAGLPNSEAKAFIHPDLSNAERYEQYASFSPHGDEFYLSVTDQNWRYRGILYSQFENGQWSKLDTVAFTRHGRDGGEQVLQGDSLYFISFRYDKKVRQTDIYRTIKNSSGWKEPTRLPEPINSTGNEWHPTFTAKGNMYFASERNNKKFQADIYKAEFANGVYSHPVKLGEPVNSEYNDGDPLISPDETFLIFHSERPGGFGGHDLYISFRTKDGLWTKAKNMGSSINSAALEFGPSLSPDGNYFFFTRRESFETNIPSKIYWLSADVIDMLRK